MNLWRRILRLISLSFVAKLQNDWVYEQRSEDFSLLAPPHVRRRTNWEGVSFYRYCVNTRERQACVLMTHCISVRRSEWGIDAGKLWWRPDEYGTPFEFFVGSVEGIAEKNRQLNELRTARKQALNEIRQEWSVVDEEMRKLLP
jgi:hypothetical protein